MFDIVLLFRSKRAKNPQKVVPNYLMQNKWSYLRKESIISEKGLLFSHSKRGILLMKECIPLLRSYEKTPHSFRMRRSFSIFTVQAPTLY